MKPARMLSIVLFGALAAGSAPAAPAVEAAIGASYFKLRDARLEGSPTPFQVDEPSKVAPFISGLYPFSERFGVRVSYHFLDNVRTTAAFGSPPGVPPPSLPIVVFGHYSDDVHLLAVAPELKWTSFPNMTLSVAPQLNLVVSRGRVSYSTDYALITLVPPHRRNDEGFTFGGAARLAWSIGRRVALSAGYQYLDLHPSFDREAHVFSGGVSWRF